MPTAQNFWIYYQLLVVAGTLLIAVANVASAVAVWRFVRYAIPEIKKIVRSVTMEQALEVARRVLSFDSEKEIMNYLRMETHKLLPEAYPD